MNRNPTKYADLQLILDANGKLPIGSIGAKINGLLADAKGEALRTLDYTKYNLLQTIYKLPLG